MPVEENLIPVIHNLVGHHVRVTIGEHSYSGVLEEEAEYGYMVGAQVFYPWLVTKIVKVGDIYELTVSDATSEELTIDDLYTKLYADITEKVSDSYPDIEVSVIDLGNHPFLLDVDPCHWLTQVSDAE